MSFGRSVLNLSNAHDRMMPTYLDKGHACHEGPATRMTHEGLTSAIDFGRAMEDCLVLTSSVDDRGTSLTLTCRSASVFEKAR